MLHAMQKAVTDEIDA